MFGRKAACLLAFSMSTLACHWCAGQRTRSEGAGDRQVPATRNFHIPGIPQPRPIAFPPIRTPSPIGFPELTRAAGIIFSGKVIRVERGATATGQSVESVAVTFHVEGAIRGSSSGKDLTIREWIGAWSSGQRYRIGERVLLFLYPQSKVGLTSTVGGAMGRFEMDPQGVLLSPQHVFTFRSDPVLGGKSRAEFSEFALAIRRAGEVK